ncbi:SCO1/SenC/PrrC protein, involved in biogenesis of respiratory and photosynthetic system [Pseudomonas knackmussii B13]|uniref:SCO1/SenC/PrrC protein, involved in biogenesis of respiratory and photosynthetic system n=2 Tax=Pseudomonas knackmussii TaxID=65741 RepID=A0A024HBZ3_PSEKB|nr:SCO1/SenC/PrrC protein, involved in biogenesis of respiratory and photosynthetic system [Pseudomonas knackmussii B13]
MKRAARWLKPWLLLLAAACHMAAAEGDGPWGRDYFPNTELVDQDGRHVRFFDDLIAGKVVAINFIFTGCSATCPAETARLRQVQKLLGDRVGKDLYFYSISIDPVADTPEVLKAYAERFHVGPGWRFLTGDFAAITELRQRLGLLDARIDPQNKSQHSLSLIIGNQATGQWMKVSPFENPYILADRLGNELHNWKLASAKPNSYADAPQLRTPSHGEQLFRTRCSACHSLGADANALRQAIGPDLAGVTQRRERAWLSRWLREPDRMLAEQDPIASALYQQFNQVAMPNMGLGETDVEALLTYLDNPLPPTAPAKPALQQASQ